MAKATWEPGQPGDFATFVCAYQDMVFTTAARITGNDAQAQDIAQEAFLKAFEQFAELRSSPTAGGWLKTVATNLSLNYVSRHRRRWRFFSELRAADDESEVEFAAPDNSLGELDADRRHELIEKALQRLPDHQRIPLVLYHFEEMPYADIATRLRISLAKVKTDILRGRTALAHSLARSGLAEFGSE